ncbi:MAG TPA: sulfotransferase [Geminicoccaceae bacterium]|nr:sulfotransferase [Geminicoccaceae bacterium]
MPRAREDGLEAAPRPLLVIGLTARTGTNYLARLLAAHKDCTRPNALYEDYMVFGLRHLNRFIRQAGGHWQPATASEKQKQLRLLLGGAITRFLLEDARDPRKRPVFKTPTVWGVAHAQQFLPRCDIVVLTRNGPDVVESGMRSFGWRFESASRFWGDAARYLVQTCRDRQRDGMTPLTVVRYEDLVTQPTATLRAIFAAVDLPADRFDFDRPANFPVYGSSTERGRSEGVTWESVDKPAGFEPLRRSQHWSEDAYRRFDWLTKGISRDLGYELPFVFENRRGLRYRYLLRDQKLRLPSFLQERLRYAP